MSEPNPVIQAGEVRPDHHVEALKRRRHKIEPEHHDIILPVDPRTLPRIKLTRHEEALVDHVIEVAFMAPGQQRR